MSDHRSQPSSFTAAVAPRAVTALLVVGPLVAVAVAVPALWGHAVHLSDIILGVVLYAVFGHGISAGFHRLFAHRAFRANRGLKVGLAVAGSMAVEGSVTSWVANHRRHHVFSDQPGDPHSPHTQPGGAHARWRGFVHAHVGWLFAVDATSEERFAPDMLKDADIRVVNRLFPFLAVASLALPFLIGWGLSRSPAGGLTALLWAGLVRMALFHHVTWSVNSVCHMIGRRPFTTRDESRNVAALAVLSLGESWHNLHHAYPTSARHGALRGQVDSSARLIRIFEKIGWVSNVRWPAPGRLEALEIRTEELVAA